MATTPFAQVQEQFAQAQDQLTEAYAVLRARVEEAVDQAVERAQVAGDLAVKLAYAGVGAALVAQEQVSHRVAELVNQR